MSSHPIPLPNPNLAKSKRRESGPRPRTQNTPSDPTKKTFKWVEPLSEPVSFESDFTQIQTEEYPIEFEIDYFVPRTIYAPYVEAATGLIYRTTGDQRLIPRITEGLKGLAYFKSARKVYGTFSDDAKTSLQPLKGVWYDNLQVPTTMARLIDTFGNFDTMFGKAKHKYQRTIFLRWIAMGLSDTPALSEHSAPGAKDGTPDQFLWRDQEAVDLVYDKAAEKMAQMRSVTHKITQTVRSVEFKIDASLPAWSNNYANTVGFPVDIRNEWRLTGLCSEIQLNMFDPTVKLPPGTPPGADLTSILQVLHLARAPDSYSYSAMRDGFNTFQRNYTRLVHPHMSSYFKMSDAPHGDHGHAAQLSSSGGMAESSKLPLSDADLANGFILDANRGFEFKPTYIAYSKRRVDVARATVANDSLGSIAH